MIHFEKIVEEWAQEMSVRMTKAQLMALDMEDGYQEKASLTGFIQGLATAMKELNKIEKEYREQKKI